MSEKIVYLMRGLPSCGKSTKARKLAGDTGLVFETDQFFYTQIGDDPTRFDYDPARMPEARDWNFQRFTQAVNAGRCPLVVDRGNGLTLESQRYARYSVDRGYRVELAEPDSPWWQDLRVLLKYKAETMPILEKWARKLAEMSRASHRVPVSTILRWMQHWKWDLTVQDILDYKPKEKDQPQMNADERR